ncbi:MAG: nucleotidyltransferase [Verrucomicrobiota bacterium]
MQLPSYFSTFLDEIRLTDNQKSNAQTGHKTLRDRLLEDEEISPLIVGTFLQGSYKRSTAVRPSGDKRADVDVVVVTKLSDEEYDPKDIVPIFEKFLDQYYKGKWELQGRSFGIGLTYVDLDLVVTAAPSETEIGIYKSAEVLDEKTLEESVDADVLVSFSAKTAAAWKDSPLLIPDQDQNEWDETHPLEQIRWTQAKNASCNLHYVNVVKALKWWRRIKCPTPKYPKGYPVEHLIGLCCPDGITSVADGVVLTLETITLNYSGYAALGKTPFLADHGVPAHNVFGRVDGADFASFYAQCTAAAKTARAAMDADNKHDSAKLWRELFGDKFPEAPGDGGGSVTKGSEPPSCGYTPSTGPGIIEGGRFA